jgi:hypothetical protein
MRSLAPWFWLVPTDGPVTESRFDIPKHHAVAQRPERGHLMSFWPQMAAPKRSQDADTWNVSTPWGARCPLPDRSYISCAP